MKLNLAVYDDLSLLGTTKAFHQLSEPERVALYVRVRVCGKGLIELTPKELDVVVAGIAELARKKGAGGKGLEDFEYLIHHIEVDEKGTEEIHHCLLIDHMANMFEHGHLVVKNGEAMINGKPAEDGTYHFIKGLEPSQEVCWSEEEATEAGVSPKKIVAGMTLKDKAKEW